MGLQQGAIFCLVASALLIGALILSAYVTRRIWRMRRAVIGDAQVGISDIRAAWSGVCDWWRARRDPEFAKRLSVCCDYSDALGTILALRERAAWHRIMSERALSELARSCHASERGLCERALPEVSIQAARAITGLSDEQIDHVAEWLSKTVADPRALKVVGCDAVAIPPERLAGFLRAERGLIARDPRKMVEHADRLAKFIHIEVEGARAAAEKSEVRDADAS